MGKILEPKEESLVRQILKNEFTWLAGIVAGIWMFVTTVILLINTIQAQLAQIQQVIVGNKTQFGNLETQYFDLSSRVSSLEAEFKSLTQ